MNNAFLILAIVCVTIFFWAFVVGFFTNSFFIALLVQVSLGILLCFVFFNFLGYGILFFGPPAFVCVLLGTGFGAACSSPTPENKNDDQ
jgi:hypothetical protein